MRTLSIVMLVLFGLLLLRASAYTVDAAEYAYVTVLGRHVATHDGGDAEAGAGLHIGWPWPFQSVQRLDRRLQYFDLPGREILTHDPEGKTVGKRLYIEGYVCWRIADAKAVDLFVRRLGSADRARTILEPRINGELGAALTERRMEDLVNAESGQVEENVARLREDLMGKLQKPLLEDYGIELVDVRLRRFGYPSSVRMSIFARIRSEREKKAAESRSEGELQARNIETKAEEAARALLAKARFEEERLKGQADAEAMVIRNKAHQQDPEFYGFLKKMEKLQSILGDNKTVLLLSTNRPLFELLFAPPRPEMKSEKK